MAEDSNNIFYVNSYSVETLDQENKGMTIIRDAATQVQQKVDFSLSSQLQSIMLAGNEINTKAEDDSHRIKLYTSSILKYPNPDTSSPDAFLEITTSRQVTTIPEDMTLSDIQNVPLSTTLLLNPSPVVVTNENQYNVEFSYRISWLSDFVVTQRANQLIAAGGFATAEMEVVFNVLKENFLQRNTFFDVPLPVIFRLPKGDANGK